MKFNLFKLEPKQGVIKVLLIYSSKNRSDKNLVVQLKDHLATAIYQKNIKLAELDFAEDDIQNKWTRWGIDGDVDILVALISSSLTEILSRISSPNGSQFIDYINELREKRRITIVPVLLQSTHSWQRFFGDLQFLPRSGKSIGELPHSERNKAFSKVMESLDEILNEEINRRKAEEVARQERIKTIKRDVIQVWKRLKQRRREVLLGLSVFCFLGLVMWLYHSRPSANDYIQRGKAYSTEQEFEEAIEEFSRAIELDSNNFSHYNDRGDAYYSQGDFSAALGDYSRSITINGENVYGYRRRGESYLKLGKVKEAINNFRVAANLYQKQGNVSEYQNMMDLITKLESDLPLVEE